MLNLDDTIIALASAPGPGRRGIVRISGPQTAACVRLRFESDVEWWTRRVPWRTDGTLHIDSVCVPLPAALQYWPTSRSYTGQPMAELHLISSPPLLDAAIESVCRAGARLARRGEFTLRAFLSGRIDLLQAEAVLGVIEAADDQELRAALGQLGGSVTARVAAVRMNLIALLGDLEAGLDFVDEDIEFVSREAIAERLRAAAGSVESLLSDATARLPAGYRPRVVLAGLPNAGKSTLFNRLAGASRAVVSPAAGTTRDYVSAVATLRRREVELIDTAGWETTPDRLLQLAQEVRSEQIASADLILWCSACDLSVADRRHDESLRSVATRRGVMMLPVVTCVDRTETPARVMEEPAADQEPVTRSLRVSAVTDDGIAELIDAIVEMLTGEGVARGELLGISAVRCRDSLSRALKSLTDAESLIQANAGDEILASELRQALRELATILGEVYTDDILDHIFSSFCIGK